VAITDHVDATNIDCVARIIDAVMDIRDNWDIEIIPGAEITHAPAEIIPKLARMAKNKGAEIIVVHGETLVEPVIEGTNWSAVNCPDVDILAHPGLITLKEAEAARKNDVALEISARKGHCLGNGHVTEMGLMAGADLIVDTDTHAPEDLIDYNMAEKIALGAGLPEENLLEVLRDNPLKLLEKKGIF
jgi:histidinol phosphatase-like PHP family hydrolase